MLRTAERLVDATAAARHGVTLHFSDGSSRTVEVSHLLSGPMFEEIAASDEAFNTLYFDSELGTVCWPNAADIAPEMLLSLPARA